jgi:hypothetical protein
MKIKIGRVYICTDDCPMVREYNAFRLNMKLGYNFTDKFKRSRKYRKWKKRYDRETSISRSKEEGK